MKTLSNISQKPVLHIVLLGILFLVAFTSRGQVRSNRFVVPRQYTIYNGYEVTMGKQDFRLRSDIGELNNLAVHQIGASVGASFSNYLGKLRPTIGLYYSDGATAYTVDAGSADVAGNLYVMRLFDKKFHTIEPYVMGAVGYQRMKFFGSYLGHDATYNYSMSEEPLLGSVDFLRATTGIGAEYQIANDALHFIHLFTEVSMTNSAFVRSSNDDFSRTTANRGLKFSIGLSFGFAKY